VYVSGKKKIRERPKHPSQGSSTRRLDDTDVMVQGQVPSTCLSHLNNHIPFILLAFLISSLAFIWYNMSQYSRSGTSHSTPHSILSGPGQLGATPDMYSVVNKPTATSAAATAFITPSSPVPRPDAASIQPRNRELPLSMNEQHYAIRVPQSYDAFLVLDVEATCLQGTDFHWPNEIIVRYHPETGTRSHHLTEYRNGPSVSSNGWTRGWTERPVPCKRLQNFAALLSRHGAPSYRSSVRPSLA